MISQNLIDQMVRAKNFEVMPPARMMGDLRPILLAVLMLAGCASAPAVLPAPPVERMMWVIQNPYFNKLDGASFDGAKVKYPTGDYYHVVPVSEFLAAEIIKVLPTGRNVSSIKLISFDVKCERTSFVLPQASCSGGMNLSIKSGKETYVFSGKVRGEKIGPLMKAFGDPFGTPSGGDKIIADQVKIVVIDLVNQIGRKAKKDL